MKYSTNFLWREVKKVTDFSESEFCSNSFFSLYVAENLARIDHANVSIFEAKENIFRYKVRAYIYTMHIYVPSNFIPKKSQYSWHSCYKGSKLKLNLIAIVICFLLGHNHNPCHAINSKLLI